MRLLTGPVFGVVLLAGLAACEGDEREPDPPVAVTSGGERLPDPPVELTAGDACGDAWFWAATGSGDIAVTVSIDAVDRSSAEAMVQDFVLPDGTVTVQVLEGRGMRQNFCTDAVNGSAEPRERQGAVAGEGTIRLDPLPPGPDPMSCGSVAGELELTGLEAEDGTTFAPIRVSSHSIGCYSG